MRNMDCIGVAKSIIKSDTRVFHGKEIQTLIIIRRGEEKLTTIVPVDE